MKVGHRRLSVGQLNGRHPERPHVAAHVVVIFQLLLARNHLYEEQKVNNILSPYSTRNRGSVGCPKQGKKCTNNMIFTCPARTNANVPNMNYILLARIGPRVWLVEVRVVSTGVRVGSAGVFRYLHVGFPNAQVQR